MVTPDEIAAFLRDFHEKIGVCGLVVRDERGRTSQTLLDLEITRQERDDILLSIRPEDYCEGPLPDRLNGPAAMWVFRKAIKGEKIVIAVTMGERGSQVMCIAFRTPEFALQVKSIF